MLQEPKISLRNIRSVFLNENCTYQQRSYRLEFLVVIVLKESQDGVTVVGQCVQYEELVKDKDNFLGLQAGLLQQLGQRRPWIALC